MLQKVHATVLCSFSNELWQLGATALHEKVVEGKFAEAPFHCRASNLTSSMCSPMALTF